MFEYFHRTFMAPNGAILRSLSATKATKQVAAPKPATPATKKRPTNSVNMDKVDKLTKHSMISVLSQRLGTPPKLTSNFLNEFLDIVEDFTVKRGKRVMLGGFGTFCPEAIGKQVVTSPHTGQTVQKTTGYKIGFIGSKSSSSST